MDQEQQFFETLLNEGNTFAVDDQRLKISDRNGVAVLIFSARETFAVSPEDLVDTEWQLTSFDGDEVLDDSRLTIAFDDLSIPLPPMRAPDNRQLIIEKVLEKAYARGVEDIHLIAALANHPA
jgi:heat shock protein HslJ